MINNMISISLDGKPCVSETYSILFIYNYINLILIRVERKSLIRKMLIPIRVPFDSETSLARKGSGMVQLRIFAVDQSGVAGVELATAGEPPARQPRIWGRRPSGVDPSHP